jgi:hypothetical protein
MSLKLEEHLAAKAGIIKPNAEWQIDILRDILCSQIGTAAQRASIIRLIKLHAPKKPFHSRISSNLGLPIEDRGTYLHT